MTIRLIAILRVLAITRIKNGSSISCSVTNLLLNFDKMPNMIHFRVNIRPPKSMLSITPCKKCAARIKSMSSIK